MTYFQMRQPSSAHVKIDLKEIMTDIEYLAKRTFLNRTKIMMHISETLSFGDK